MACETWTLDSLFQRMPAYFRLQNLQSICATLSVLSHDVYVIIFRRINEVIYAAMSHNWQCVSTSVCGLDHK